MNIVFAYLVGIGLPAVNGWLLLGLFQKGTRVLNGLERWTAGAMIGMTFSMFLAFGMNVLFNMPLSWIGYLSVQGALLAVLLTLSFVLLKPINAMPTLMNERAEISRQPRWIRITLWALVGWVVVKMLIAGTVFLFLTPSYLDDSLDNWNLRGKMFYTDQTVLPISNDADSIAYQKGVGSYPPDVPLTKAWIASLAGEWTDAAANGIHLFYYIVALLLIASTVRRFAGAGWDLFAVYVVGSIPLYLMHGTNPYADAFLSVHVLLAVIFPLRAIKEADPKKRLALLRIGAFCAALLPFTKNEALLLYLPPLLLIVGIGLFIAVRRKVMTKTDALIAIGWYAGLLLLLGLPWLIFKWSHGLTFGNAKPFSTVDISFQHGVLFAMFVNMFFEGNWLLLFPLLIGLLIWRRRAAFGKWLPLTAYVAIVYAGQSLIFLFTSLSVEAKMQTGLARGGVQLLPLFVLLSVLLLADAWPIIRSASLALGRSIGILRA